MLTERDLIETWPEMGISFEPVKLKIRLPLNILDPKKLSMVGLASTLPILTAGCGAASFVDDFGGRSLTALVNYAGVSIFSSLATDNKKINRVLGGIGAGVGLVLPWTAIFGLFLGTAGVVIKINEKDRNIRLAREEKQAGEEAARALARYQGIRRMQGKE